MYQLGLALIPRADAAAGRPRPVDRLTLNVAVDGETPLPSSAPRSRSIHIRHRRKRKGVQYCMQCNGLPDTAMIHIPLGQISNDLSAQKRTLCRTSYVTPATLGARATFSSGGGLGRILRHAYVRSFVLFPSRSYSPPSSVVRVRPFSSASRK